MFRWQRHLFIGLRDQGRVGSQFLDAQQLLSSCPTLVPALTNTVYA
jgi:hypothetical protein